MLLSLQHDILKYIIFSPNGPLDNCSLAVCRFVCRYLRSLIPRQHNRIETLAAEYGYIEILKWAYKKGANSTEQLSFTAARAGQLEVIQWFANVHPQWQVDHTTCCLAARGGHLPILQWMRSKRATLDEQVCSNAALGGHTHVLKWLRSQSAQWDQFTCSYAASRGHLETLKYARSEGAPWDTWTCAHAAAGGHFEVLQWARANGAPWDRNVCANAAGGGHLLTLIWAYENGAVLDQHAWDLAAKCGQLHILQWGKKFDDERWKTEVCYQATIGGYLQVLQWTRANGAPWDKQACLQIAWREEIRKWICEQPD